MTTPERIGKYQIVVDFSRLPDSFPNKAQIEASGIGEVPLTLYVDQLGRSRRAVIVLTVSGQKLTTQFTLSKFNEPVSIEAPPASQTTSG